MILQEQNIMVESKYFLLYYTIDYINHKFLIDVYSKEEKTTIISEFEIKGMVLQRMFLRRIDKAPGTVFKKGKTRFLIRNHDKVIDHEDKDGVHFSYDKNSKYSIYDTRNNVSSLIKLPLYLKEIWVHI